MKNLRLLMVLFMVLFLVTVLIAGCTPEEDPTADPVNDIETDEPEDVEIAPGVQEIRWGTSAVGSAGHGALVSLMTLLNREMSDYHITVLPTPGAVFTVKSFAQDEMDGYYGADIAFYEYARDIERFEGFQADVVREPVQTFWAYPMEVGLAVRATDSDKYNEWRDLAGENVFTGPAPWDVRMNLERAMAILEVNHNYTEQDLGMVSSALDAGHIEAFIVYTAAEASVAPWIIEVELATDIAVLNPSPEEMQMIKDGGMDVVEVDPDVFETDVHVNSVSLVPFIYGFHVGLDVPEDDVYKMLTIIEEFSEELMMTDRSYAVLHDDMVEMQRRGVASAINDVKVHPGLARFLQERGVWEDAWDDRIAQ